MNLAPLVVVGVVACGGGGGPDGSPPADATAPDSSPPADATVPQDLAGEQLIVHLQDRGHQEFVVLDGSGAVAGLLLARDVAASLAGRRG